MYDRGQCQEQRQSRQFLSSIAHLVTASSPSGWPLPTDMTTLFGTQAITPPSDPFEPCECIAYTDKGCDDPRPSAFNADNRVSQRSRHGQRAIPIQRVRAYNPVSAANMDMGSSRHYPLRQGKKQRGGGEQKRDDKQSIGQCSVEVTIQLRFVRTYLF